MLIVDTIIPTIKCKLEAKSTAKIKGILVYDHLKKENKKGKYISVFFLINTHTQYDYRNIYEPILCFQRSCLCFNNISRRNLSFHIM